MREKIAKSLRSITRHQALRSEPKHTNGKREANKLDKPDRIKQVPASVHNCRLRQIHHPTNRQEGRRRAGHGVHLCDDERDLLYLVSDDLLAGARDLAAKSFRQDRSLEHNFVAFCAVFYKVIGAQPRLSKVVFRDLSFYNSGIHSVAVLANRVRTLKSIEALVVAAHEKGEIHLPVPPDFVAWLLFSIFQAENRRWLALKHHDLEEGLSHLWTSVVVLLKGLSADPASYRPPRAELREILAKGRPSHF